MKLFDYLKSARKLIRHIPYLYKEEVLFKHHVDYMIKERINHNEKIEGLRVLIVSKMFMRNFGDRLGFHNVSLLTSLAQNISYIDFDDPELLEKDPSKYDVVIIGTGNSLFHNMITDDFYAYLSNAKHLIGIFGFQYYEVLEERKVLFEKCINQFDKIFIRYKKDISFLERLEISTQKVVHFGDWLVMLFPMTSYNSDKTLNIIGKEPFIRNALDVYMQEIQTYKYVHSARLHTLLCAMCSAEKVSYSEQYDKKHPGISSGKFEGLFNDIFNEHVKPDEFYSVDKHAVVNYKNHVSAQFLEVVSYINSISVTR